MSVRVRMAPSLTGFLPTGGGGTFLFQWLLSRPPPPPGSPPPGGCPPSLFTGLSPRGRGGECLLRIENTDTSREVSESIDQIQRSLTWLGVDWGGAGAVRVARG